MYQLGNAPMTLACLQIPLHWLRAVPGGHEESSPSLGEPLLQHHLLQAGYPLLPPEVPAASHSWLVGTHRRDAFSALSEVWLAKRNPR